MIARYCVFVHIYCQYMRLDGIHSVIGAEKFFVGLQSKSQLYKILDVEKTRYGSSSSHFIIHIRIHKTHANTTHTKYVRFKAYMYKKKHRPEYTLKY